MTIMNDEQYNAITNTLATLVAGQGTTNLHLGILNGKVAAHEISINKMLIEDAATGGFNDAISYGWTFIIALVSSGAVGTIVYFFLHK